ncbi:tellurite resistance TerB family protein [Denitromonas iodatirespirans]|uniref:TerB family tellurite resistance protein n=1 Tax=Denitromonas iodatirespirans TaxID=2795389 RepID=A0A944D955_DENI1|nr:TerB family tellurite resistance protein [Denitromonas iodatirespirans]MBT0960197.1 TerB family tellurite resistance protein [Denitromonas iodatirespirans]
MIPSLRSFLNTLTAPDTDAQDEAVSLQLATAALLVEMMRADSDVSPAETDSIRRLLANDFHLDTEAVDRLLDEAQTEAREAPGYHPFTSRLNQDLDAAQKVRVVECLWSIALADGQICAHENHLMRKLADLLHVSHGDYIAAKARAQAARGNSTD